MAKVKKKLLPITLIIITAFAAAVAVANLLSLHNLLENGNSYDNVHPNQI